MRVACTIAAFAVSLHVGAGTARAQGNTVTLSFAEAEASALETSTAIAIADRGVEAAELGLDSTRSLRLPRVSLESNLLVWDEALVFDISIPGMEPPPGMEIDPITVRDRITSTTTISVAEPLSTQFVLSDAIGLSEYEVEVAEEERRGAKISAAYEASDAYIKVLLARASVEIAATRVKQISAQLSRVEVLVTEGVAEPVDALRLQTALAGARADVIKAESNAQLAMGLLGLATGLPPLTQIEVTDDFPAEPGPPPLSVADSVVTAQNTRTELSVLRMRTEQAKLGANIEKAKLVPNILAVASFTHNEGMGTLQPKNAWFVGLTLSWDLWDWGGNWNAHKAAKANAEKLELSQVQVRDGIRIQVGVTAADTYSHYELLDVTRTGVTAAAEAFRIQKDRYEEGAATTTDLLDAEAELANAKLAHATARYAYFGSLVELARVTGQLPSALFDQLGGTR